MGKRSKHKEKKKKRASDAKNATEPDEDTAAVPVSEPTRSTLVREDWMTKPKEGWLSAGPRRPQKPEPAPNAEPRQHEAGLFVPEGSRSRERPSGRAAVGDGGVSWRLKALKRMTQRSREEDKSLEQVAEERGVNLEQLMKEASKPAAKPRNRSQRPPHRSYLDDIHSTRSQMRKPRTERSSFARKQDREDKPEVLNRFPNDGSFMQTFSEMAERGLQQPTSDRIQSAVGRGNTSAAAQLRAQLKTGAATPQSASGTHRETVVLPMMGADGKVAPGLFGREDTNKKRRELDDHADIATLYKRSKHGDDALDLDRALAHNISRKHRFSAREDMDVDMEYDYGVGTDLFEKKRKKNRRLTLSDLQHRERQYQVRAEQKRQTLEDRCVYCFDGPKMPKHLVVSIATTAYLRLPQKGALDPLHCYIVPLEHLPTTREVEEDAWTEIRNFKKALIQMSRAQGREMIFIETAMYVQDHGRHSLVECVPVVAEVLERAPLYFKKAIDDATADWSQHHSKRCIETGTKGLRGSIPEHFPYFHVEFNLSHGFVHVLDDEANFDADLGRRVLMSLMQKPAEDMYKRLESDSIEEQRQAVDQFVKQWHPFDWTLQL